MPGRLQRLDGLTVGKKQTKSKKKTVKRKSPPPQGSRGQQGTEAKSYRAGFYSDQGIVKADFAEKVSQIAKLTRQRVVLLWQSNADSDFCFLNDETYLCFAANIDALERGKKVTVLIKSPGGEARAAYKLALLLRKHCGGFTVCVPYWAKSAATLFALGADEIILSRFAELGPLDAQIFDDEKEQRFSALEVVQAIERLNSEAMGAVDAHMLFWLRRCRKKVDALLPVATHFVAEMMRPLFEKIDTVNYTGMARVLKVAQDYAERLLVATGRNRPDAQSIADKLTNAYSEHGFVIDCEELRRIGIRTAKEAQGELGDVLEEMVLMEPGSVMLGPLREV